MKYVHSQLSVFKSSSIMLVGLMVLRPFTGALHSFNTHFSPSSTVHHLCLQELELQRLCSSHHSDVFLLTVCWHYTACFLFIHLSHTTFMTQLIRFWQNMLQLWISPKQVTQWICQWVCQSSALFKEMTCWLLPAKFSRQKFLTAILSHIAARIMALCFK